MAWGWVVNRANGYVGVWGWVRGWVCMTDVLLFGCCCCCLVVVVVVVDLCFCLLALLSFLPLLLLPPLLPLLSLLSLSSPFFQVSFNSFDTGTDFKPLVYGQCSNPTYKTKQDCLAQGVCPDDLTLTTREECVTAGGAMKCVMPPGFEHMNNQFHTMDECENPALRKILSAMPGRYTCKHL